MVYLYLNFDNQAVYTNDVDSPVIKANTSLKRFIIRPEYFGLFIRYYQIRLHPEAKKNVVN
jgi:hypothetical protein